MNTIGMKYHPKRLSSSFKTWTLEFSGIKEFMTI